MDHCVQAAVDLDVHVAGREIIGNPCKDPGLSALDLPLDALALVLLHLLFRLDFACIDVLVDDIFQDISPRFTAGVQLEGDTADGNLLFRDDGVQVLCLRLDIPELAGEVNGDQAEQDDHEVVFPEHFPARRFPFFAGPCRSFLCCSHI